MYFTIHVHHAQYTLRMVRIKGKVPCCIELWSILCAYASNSLPARLLLILPPFFDAYFQQFSVLSGLSSSELSLFVPQPLL